MSYRFTLVSCLAAGALAAAACSTPPTFDSGAGGGTGASSTTTTGTCSPAGPEECFNGADDDCDGTLDCEDADCTPVATCEPLPAGAGLGALVGAAESCPPGYTAEEIPLFRGLVDDGCEGCGCTVDPTQCVGHVFYYTNAASCTNDVNMTAGISGGTAVYGACPNPIYSGTIYGVRAGAHDVIQGCTANGSGTPAPVAWNESGKFCRVAPTSQGGGCAANAACVPIPESGTTCAYGTGSVSCEGFATSEPDWYTGENDTRGCSACDCVASGGGCNNARVGVGTDYSCTDNPQLQQNTKQCFQVYSPPVRMAGTVTQGTCTVDVTETGSLDPVGQSTLCCQ